MRTFISSNLVYVLENLEKRPINYLLLKKGNQSAMTYVCKSTDKDILKQSKECKQHFYTLTFWNKNSGCTLVGLPN